MAHRMCHGIARLFYLGKNTHPGKSLKPKLLLKYTKLLYKYKEKSKNLHNLLLSPI